MHRARRIGGRERARAAVPPRRTQPHGMLWRAVGVALACLLTASCATPDNFSNVTFRQMSGTTFATATNKSIYRSAISINRLVRPRWTTLKPNARTRDTLVTRSHCLL